VTANTVAAASAAAGMVLTVWGLAGMWGWRRRRERVVRPSVVAGPPPGG
jgi:MYXO-CTERM domain-containing protein